MLRLNLSKKDLAQVDLLVRPVNFYNLRAIWLQMPPESLDDKGNCSAKELEEELLVGENIPEYLADFLVRYESTEERLRYFPSLFADLYRDEKLHGFLRRYFQLEREIRLILTALRAKAFQRNVVRELQFEDPQDPMVAHILAQKDADEYAPSREYEDLKALFMENITDPHKLNRAIVEYRFAKIEELETGKEFTIDQILGYLARLILVEDWHKPNLEKGRRILEQFSENG